LFVLEEALQC